MQPRRSSVRQPAIFDRGQTRRHKPDYGLVLMSILLLLVGLVVVYSISPGLAAQKDVSENYYVVKQLLSVLLGIIVFVIVSVVPLKKWRDWQKPLIISAAVAAVAVRLFGEEVYGAYRWIHIGGLSFQAVELIKFAMLIWLASFLADRINQGKLGDTEATFKPLLIILVILGVVVAKMQSDLGSTGVLVAMMGVMGFVAGLPIKRVMTIIGIIAVGTALLISTSAYRRDRFMTYLQPERDCQTTGYQACQALISFGSGGLFGKGLGHGAQAFGYLPEAANDSIFAIIGEKFGFVGTTLLLVLFLALFTRLFKIAERTPDNFNRLLMIGILTWLSTQTLINVGAMIGLLPLKGITLPFISYGGTSIMFVSAALGLAFNISRYTTYAVVADNEQGRSSHESPTYGRRNGRPHYAHISRRG